MLLPGICLTVAETSPELSSSISLGIGTLHIQDNTNQGWPLTPCQDGSCKSSKKYLQETAASLTCTLAAPHDTGPVARGAGSDVQTDDSEVKKAVGEGDHDNLDLEKPLNELISLPLDKRPPFVSEASAPEVPPLNNILELNHLASAVEDASSQGSPMSDTDSDSDGVWLARRALAVAWQASDQHDMTTFPTFDSKWTAKFTNHTGHKGSASTSTTPASKSARHSASTSSSSHNSRKRSLGNDVGDPADGDDEPPERPRFYLPEPQDLVGSVKLACPFLKHDPGKYNPSDYHNCATTPWGSIDRLK